MDTTTPEAAPARSIAGPVLDAAHFLEPRCHNCGAPLDTAYCSRCGQKRARRLGIRDLGHETWQKWRLFELSAAATAWRLLWRPGRVAREYVLGARARHFHPLKLLLVMVALLLVVLSQTGYLRAADGQANEVLATVQAWGKWSFTLGIFAVVGSSLAMFGRRLGYNLVEHLVLAAYCQSVVIALQLLNQLPLLLLPELVDAHRAAAGWYMAAVKAGVVAIAFHQFFLLELRRDGARLALAVLLYLGCSWLLVQAYSEAVVRIVLARLA